MPCRIGIIGDGPTDLSIVGRLAECAATLNVSRTLSVELIELRRQNLRDAVDRYWQEAIRSDDYSVTGRAGLKLLGAASAMLHGAINDFESSLRGEGVSWRDVIVLSTDTERHFATSDRYFDAWATHMPKILLTAAEKTCHQLIQWGRDPSIVPTIVPLPLFPSSETIVAAAKDNFGAIHGLRPGELKVKLYNVRDLKMLSREEFERQAMEPLTRNSIEQIFRLIPESRPLIHVLLQRW